MRFYPVLLLVTVAISCIQTPSDPCNEPPGELSSIQAAIDAAADGDTVVVPAGTYVENIVIDGKDIVLIGDTVNQRVVLQPAQSGEPIVSFDDIAARSTQIVGFVIEGAEGAPGVYCLDASPTIHKCCIRDNDGGGIRLTGSGLALITGNEIYRNAAGASVGERMLSSASVPDYHTLGAETAHLLTASGGGIAMAGGAADIIGNVIDSNRASLGGAIFGINEQAHVIEDNVIRCNFASLGGGGLYFYEGGPVLVRDNLFVSDTSNHGGGSANSARSYLVFDGNTFDKCVAGTRNGGGNAIWWAHGAPYGGAVKNNIITNTTTASNPLGGAVACDASIVGRLEVDYNTFYNNSPADTYRLSPGTSSQHADPRYCDPVAGDYHLAAGSPCIGTAADGGDRGAFPAGCSLRAVHAATNIALPR